jgi:hypothetical protein
MKRILLVSFAIFFVCSLGVAQVIADFEADANGFADNGWGSGFTSVGTAATPSGTGMALRLAWDGSKGDKGVLQVDNLDTKKAQILTYWIYLPTGTPDSIQFTLWGQDNASWGWTTMPGVMAKDIPKDKWFPLNFYLEQKRISSTNFDVYNNKFGKTGLQVDRWGETDADVNWAGNIYIDNVSLVGVQPVMLSDFSGGVGDFTKLWGGSPAFSAVTDPAGTNGQVLQAVYADGDGIGYQNATDASKGYQMCIWVYLDSNTTASNLYMNLFAQDNNSWGWNAQGYNASDVPKNKWYPLYFDMAATKAKATNFDHIAYKLGKFGLAVGNAGGTMLIDNFSFVGIEVGVKWVLADFESAAGGAMGFGIPGFGAAAQSLTREKPSTNGYLKMIVDPTKGSPAGQWAVQKSDISILDTIVKADGDSLIDAIGIDIFVPSDYSASVVGVVFQPAGDGWPWLEKQLPVKDSAGCVAPGKWSTIKWPVAEYKSQIVNPMTKGSFFLQSSATASANYEILFDNFTLYGIPQPAGKNLSPKLVAAADTVLLRKISKVVDFVKFSWIDNTMGSEKYSIYMSKTGPINDLLSPDVIKISTDIPHGLQSYGYRPYSSNGDTLDLYFAITSLDGGEESALTADCKQGPIHVKTTPTVKIKYVGDFATRSVNPFVLDGQNDEFVEYASYQIKPESSGPDTGDGGAWTPASEDCNFRTTMIIDSKYLYISADVDDDDINTDTQWQTWQGDALEFYIGYYDLRKMNAWHGKNFSGTNGDWRIGWNTLNQMTRDGSSAFAFPGVEFSLYQKIFGTSGYIVEARITLDSLAAGSKFGTVTNGLLFPLKIDCNDIDPVLRSDAARSLILGACTNPFGTKTDMDQDWVRPHAWGVAEVVDGPVVSVTDKQLVAYEYKLFDNYPNPFNPSTTLQYTLKEDVNVNLRVFNLLGQVVATVVSEKQSAGPHSVMFDASRFSSGVYFYSIEAGSFKQSKKMLLVK